jgi:hypothetical protein
LTPASLGASVLLLAILAACGSSSSDDPANHRQVAAESRFTLQTGDTVEVSGHQMLLTFDGVTADSRCPFDVTCVTEGFADLTFSWQAGPEEGSLTVRFDVRGEQADRAGPLVLRLLDLRPEVVSAVPIKPDEYRATLRLDLP